MKNWSTDIKQLQKYPQKYHLWRLEQLINFGLSGKKLEKTELKKNINKLQIDPGRKKFLKLIIK